MNFGESEKTFDGMNATNPEKFWSVFNSYFEYPTAKECMALLAKPMECTLPIPPLPMMNHAHNTGHKDMLDDSSNHNPEIDHILDQCGIKQSIIHSSAMHLQEHSMCQRVLSMHLPEDLKEWWFDRPDDYAHHPSMDDNVEILDPLLHYDSNKIVPPNPKFTDVESVLRNEIHECFFADDSQGHGGDGIAPNKSVDILQDIKWENRTDDEICACIREAQIDLSCLHDKNREVYQELLNVVTKNEHLKARKKNFEQVFHFIVEFLKKSNKIPVHDIMTLIDRVSSFPQEMMANPLDRIEEHQNIK
ncbi:hypothetical protein RFI_40313 [Reticulomyxa filosa]|uniref:Uncharacterized protein n=1 Tax=Reticulomyxa filosa TaxID=46433 RepID=X6L7E4_RETFI|nr:hypothetical protein RFI_40313 [Reticulomyxa filosa]|eukprot:ETN97218.1 hypothetical protein RFI_40313 [Reticulomyxa filosa]